MVNSACIHIGPNYIQCTSEPSWWGFQTYSQRLIQSRGILISCVPSTCSLDQCFSTGGPPSFSYYIKNQVQRQRFHKNYLKKVYLISYKSI